MLIESILNDVCLDKRVKDGCFKIENPDHMDALRDYLVKRGIDEDIATGFCNRVVEGKFPERQAYNQNGILVTFPTPEYKQRAIQKGTHFEQNPRKGQAKQSNLFQGQGQQPTGEQPSTPPAQADIDGGKGEDPNTKLPVGGSAGGGAGGGVGAAPTQTDTVTQPVGQEEPQQMTVEPQKISTDEPIPQSPAEKPKPKTAAIKAAEKVVANQILNPEDDKTGKLEIPIYEQLVRLCDYADANGLNRASSIIREKLLQ